MPLQRETVTHAVIHSQRFLTGILLDWIHLDE